MSSQFGLGTHYSVNLNSGYEQHKLKRFNGDLFLIIYWQSTGGTGLHYDLNDED
jgi:hypothetical protein